jgi:hypothetical protein
MLPRARHALLALLQSRDKRRRVIRTYETHGLNIRPYTVDFAVNIPRTVDGIAGSFNELAIFVKFANAVGCNESGCSRSRLIKMLRITAATNTNVSKTIEHGLISENPIRVDEF